MCVMWACGARAGDCIHRAATGRIIKRSDWIDRREESLAVLCEAQSFGKGQSRTKQSQVSLQSAENGTNGAEMQLCGATKVYFACFPSNIRTKYEISVGENNNIGQGCNSTNPPNQEYFIAKAKPKKSFCHVELSHRCCFYLYDH